jgi:hypothetical protein
MLVFSRWIEPAHDVTIESSGLPLQLGWPSRREVLISAELQQLKSPGIVRTFYFYSSEKRLAADAPLHGSMPIFSPVPNFTCTVAPSRLLGRNRSREPL